MILRYISITVPSEFGGPVVHRPRADFRVVAGAVEAHYYGATDRARENTRVLFEKEGAGARKLKPQDGERFIEALKQDSRSRSYSFLRELPDDAWGKGEPETVIDPEDAAKPAHA